MVLASRYAAALEKCCRLALYCRWHRSIRCQSRGVVCSGGQSLGPEYSLSAACKGSTIVLPKLQSKPKTPETTARLQELQRREEERQYAAWVHDVTASVRAELD